MTKPRGKLTRSPVFTCDCGSHAFVDATKSRVAIVDVADAALLKERCWATTGKGYLTGMFGSQMVALHRAVADPAAEEIVDHRNRNKADCRRENLRTCSHAQNNKNRRANRTGRSGLKGVSLCPHTKRWRATIMVDGVALFLGRHDTKQEAADAYDIAALQQHGEFALTNKMLAEAVNNQAETGG